MEVWLSKATADIQESRPFRNHVVLVHLEGQLLNIVASFLALYFDVLIDILAD